MSAREQVLKAHRALLNGSGELAYFEHRGITKETIEQAYVGYTAGVFVYPCVAREGGLLGVHYKSEARDENGKRRQWWGGYANDLPPKGHGKKPDEPAKIIPFGMETLKDLEPGSLVVLCCGEEDALTLRQVGFTTVSQPGAGLLEPAYARELAGFDVVVFYDAGEEAEARKDGLKLLEAGAADVRASVWPPAVPHGADVNARSIENPEIFEEWVAGMMAGARPLDFDLGGEGAEREGEPDEYGGGKQKPQAGTDVGWEDPAPLPSVLPEVAELDPAMLLGPLRAWVLDVSERMQVPPDYCAAGAVVVAASLIGRSVGIRPKRHDDWLVVPNLWGAAVGPPAALKSPALAEITKPLDRLVAEAREAHEEALAEHEAEAAAVEAEKAALKDQIKRAAKASVKTGDRSELDALIERQRNTEAPKPPILISAQTSKPRSPAAGCSRG